MSTRKYSNGEDWETSKGTVFTKIENLEDSAESVDEKLDKIFAALVQLKVDVAKLEVKSGVWGGVAGAVTVVISLLLYLFFGIVKK